MAKVVLEQGNKTIAIPDNWDGVFKPSKQRFDAMWDQYREFKSNLSEVLTDKEQRRSEVFDMLLKNKVELNNHYVLTHALGAYLILNLDAPESYISFDSDYEIVVMPKGTHSRDKCVLVVDNKVNLMFRCFDEYILLKQRYRRGFLHMLRNAQNNVYLRLMTPDVFFDYKLSHLVMGLSLPPQYSELVLGALYGRGGKSVFEVDHITPICKGGSDARGNLQLLTIEEHLLKCKYERQKSKRANRVEL